MEQRELEIIMLFPQAVHTSMRKMMSGFHPSHPDPKLNPTLGRTLMFLYDKGPLTMTELHHCLGLEKGSLTPVVDRLVELAWWQETVWPATAGR